MGANVQPPDFAYALSKLDKYESVVLSPCSHFYIELSLAVFTNNSINS